MGRFLFLIAIILIINNNVNCYQDNHRNERAVSNPLWNETSIDKLRNDLLINYDKYSKSDEYYNTTKIGIGVTITYLETDELNSTFTTSLWLVLSWKDSKLVWDPHNYNGVNSLKMADHEIWQPDIYLFNSAISGGEAIIRYGNPHALVYPNGFVVWIPPIKLTALCEFDMYYWPFDSHRCYLRFGSGSRTKKDILLEIQEIRLEELLAISQWKVGCAGEIALVRRSNYPEEFYQAIFHVTLSRKPSSTSTVLIVSIFVSVCLVLIQRFSLFQNGKALIFPCITSIVLCIFLIYFGSKVAPITSTAPWIVSFLSKCLFLNCITLMELIFVVYIFQFKNKEGISLRMKSCLNGRLGKMLLLGDCIVQCEACGMNDFYDGAKIVQRQVEHDVKKTEDCAVRHEWELFIIALDRMMFIVYGCVLVLRFLEYIF